MIVETACQADENSARTMRLPLEYKAIMEVDKILETKPAGILKPSSYNAPKRRGIHRIKVHDKENAKKQCQPIKCPCCGRQLMERQGWLHLRGLKPVSNAYVLHGHCLCHTNSEHRKEDCKEKEEEIEKADDDEVSSYICISTFLYSASGLRNNSKSMHLGQHRHVQQSQQN